MAKSANEFNSEWRWLFFQTKMGDAERHLSATAPYEDDLVKRKRWLQEFQTHESIRQQDEQLKLQADSNKMTLWMVRISFVSIILTLIFSFLTFATEIYKIKSAPPPSAQN